MDTVVIGAGIAGLAATRRLLASPEIKSVTVFEQRDTIGGTWAYTEQIGADANGLDMTPSIYRNCKSNSPNEAMRFWDLDFEEPLVPGSMLHWSLVLKYLKRYVDHFNMSKYIRLNTLVERVHPEVQENGAVKWQVQVRQLDQPDAITETHVFDAIFVCSGHYNVPHVPDLSGLSSFEGIVVNAHDYRIPEPFTDMTVVVLGGGPSGMEIGMDIAEGAKHVYLSHNNPGLTDSFPDKMSVVSVIKMVKSRSVILENGEELRVDAIILCTGYRYVFAFLSDACHPKIVQERVTPLYKHVVNVDYPSSMFFLGICKAVFGFSLDYMQAEFAVAVLLGKIQLPSREDMLRDIQEDYERRLALGFAPNHSHDMFPGRLHHQPYHDAILQLAKGSDCITPMPENWTKLIDIAFELFFSNPKLFRTGGYHVGVDKPKL